MTEDDNITPDAGESGSSGFLTLEEVAALAGTIPYELLTAIGPRVARAYR